MQLPHKGRLEQVQTAHARVAMPDRLLLGAVKNQDGDDME